jgi:dihydropteroate synthase
MGIVNVSPDSFYDGSGSCLSETALLKRCEAVIAEGGDIIDVGAVSTRPGAPEVDAAEELRRLDRALALLRKHFPNEIISVDSYRACVAKAVVENYGAGIINDISGGTLDSRMFETVAALNVPYVLTHIKGTPADMQKNPVYNNLMEDVIMYFSERVHRLRGLGVKDIIIDPGFGFGKTIAHNYEILRRLKDLKIFDLPVLVGLSNKSMIYRLLETDAGHARNGTTVANTLALTGGANMLRVHEVKEAVECIKIVEMYAYGGNLNGCS